MYSSGLVVISGNFGCLGLRSLPGSHADYVEVIDVSAAADARIAGEDDAFRRWAGCDYWFSSPDFVGEDADVGGSYSSDDCSGGSDLVVELSSGASIDLSSAEADEAACYASSLGERAAWGVMCPDHRAVLRSCGGRLGREVL